MYAHKTSIRIRYSETDQMGYVYYGNYATFYEVGRVELFRSLGISYKNLEDSGVLMPVTEMHTKFKRPTKYDDEILIKTSVKELPTMRITFFYDIYNEEAVLLNEGECTLAFLNAENMRPIQIPEKLLNLLKPYFDGV